MPEGTLLPSSRDWSRAQTWSCRSTGYHSSPPTHTLVYIWRRCVWISPCASFSSSSICAGNLSHELVSSEARERLERRTERQDNTLKASCSSLIARSSIPTISNLPPYLLSFIAEAWRALDRWKKCPQIGPDVDDAGRQCKPAAPPRGSPTQTEICFWI